MTSKSRHFVFSNQRIYHLHPD